MEGFILDKHFFKKNLFIFREYPEIFSVDDTYLIIGNKQNFNALKLSEFDNIFTIFYTPIWIKHSLSLKDINVIQIDEDGTVLEADLHKRFKSSINTHFYKESAYCLLKTKAKTIDKLFKTYEATNLIEYSLSKKLNLSEINENLNFFVKAIIMDTLKLNYNLTNKRAREITNTLFNLTENILSYSLYNKFIQEGINPENGFLNTKSPSLIKDFTEIPKIKFLKKVNHLLKTRFFHGRDLNRKHFPDTTVKFLKILSSYFFYEDRFKQLREIHSLMEAYIRGGMYEIFNCV